MELLLFVRVFVSDRYSGTTAATASVGGTGGDGKTLVTLRDREASRGQNVTLRTAVCEGDRDYDVNVTRTDVVHF